MTYFGSVLAGCDDFVRHTVKNEVMSASHRLQLCEATAS